MYLVETVNTVSVMGCGHNQDLSNELATLVMLLSNAEAFAPTKPLRCTRPTM